ncbi:MAG: MBL fold metallo-hydrolase [Pseudomonadales bacterium]
MNYTTQKGMSKLVVLLIVLLVAGLLVWLIGGESIKKSAELKTAEIVGNIATRNMGDDVAGGFHKIPIEVRQLADNVYQATGIANTHMIVTSEGNVLFDSGISIQAAKQLRLLKEVSAEPVHSIILSHSHADHASGTRFWLEDGTKVVTHREFVEEQRYLTELEPYLWRRNRTVFPWLPEEPTQNAMFRYGGVEPDILVDENDYKFELGGVQFEVLSTPGAEGADNISLWLPQQKILFSGDFFGPLFPQFPNIFTMRGEKVRKPIEYIASLDKLIALAPEMIVPSHHDPIKGKENLKASMILIRDATQYVHDEVVAGMNAGKTVYQLMQEIRLPAELELTQEHGRVSWGVKSIWEYYATWFHFDSITELYPIPVRNIYADLAELAGTDALLARAKSHVDQQESVEALHYLEIVLAADETNRDALLLRKQALEQLLEHAVTVTHNSYEKDYLRRLIVVTEEALVPAQN